MICLGVVIWAFIPLCVLSFLICSLVLTLIYRNSWLLFLQILLLFHFLSHLLVVPSHVYYIFCSCPTVLGYSALCFSVFVLFFVLEVSNEGSSSSRFLSSTVCLYSIRGILRFSFSFFFFFLNL